MTRMLVVLLVPVLALTPSLGCSKSCTDMGCGSSVSFYFPQLKLNDDLRVNVVEAEGCLGDICHTTRWRFVPNGEIRGTGNGIDVSPLGSGLGASLNLPYDADLNIRDAYPAWMELSVNGAQPVRLEDEVRLRQFLPNGSGCGPACLQADVGAPAE